MSQSDSQGQNTDPTTDLPGDQTAYLSSVVGEGLRTEPLPDFDVWMAVGESSQITIERVAEGI